MAGLGRSDSNNLPLQLTSFVGRQREVAEVKRLVASHRLLTLTGAGGCGKTRLALQVAGDLLDEFPDGVWLVDLAPLSNAAFVPRAVAAALGVPEQPNRGLHDTLADSLRPRVLLLLLDNCEHVLASCTDLAHALLRDCPDLRILATSREPLGIAGEIRWNVPSLSLPGHLELRSAAQLMKYDAVRLFVDRATAADSTFAMTDSNVRAVAHVCRQLDGIPLAIEMAAPWVRVLTLEEIVNRLSDRFQLLMSANRVGLPRHQTLKTVMDWSYDLLLDQERVLLSRLSVFSGGWTLEAAAAVCSGRRLERPDVLGLLTQLVDKSLVLAETRGGEARYRLLETIRQYGRARLMESGDAPEMQTRHRDWCLDLAERAEPKLRGPEQVMWLERLESEHDNLRAALEWSKAEESGADVGLRLAAALRDFWFMRGYFSEGREWLDGALSISRSAPAPVRALALCGAGVLAWRQGDAKGGMLLQQSLALFRELKDDWGTAYALHHLAHVPEGQGDYGQAAALFEESLALFRRVGSTWGVGWSLYCLGDVTRLQGDYSRAKALLEESLVHCREAGNHWTMAYLLGSLGLVAARQGDDKRATTLLEEGLAIARRIGAKPPVSILQGWLADLALAQGDSGRALTLHMESLALRRELGDRPGLAFCLDGLACVAATRRQYGEAARLWGATEALREALGFQLRPPDMADHDHLVASTRNALGESTFAAVQAEGRALTWEQAVHYALTAIEPSQSTRREPAKPATGRRAGLLAPREREVAVLIAEGKTNREIAAHLSITEGTAEAHVQHILNKLGVNSRAQIAAWVVAHRLQTASPAEN